MLLTRRNLFSVINPSYEVIAEKTNEAEVNSYLSPDFFLQMKYLEAQCMLHLESGNVECASETADTWFMLVRGGKKKKQKSTQINLWEYSLVSKSFLINSKNLLRCYICLAEISVRKGSLHESIFFYTEGLSAARIFHSKAFEGLFQLSLAKIECRSNQFEKCDNRLADNVKWKKEVY